MRTLGLAGALLGLLVIACGEDEGDGEQATVDVPNPLTNPEDGPRAGNPDEPCDVPAEAGLEDTADPDHVIGDGTPESCTSEAVVEGVARGGVITFDCGPDPVVIMMEEPAKIVNDTGPEIVIDGKGLVTLSG